MQMLSDEQVLDLIAAAYEVDPAFGRLVEVAATTGARISQIARLSVADLQMNGNGPRLIMPSSLKGRDRKASKTPLPISAELAAKLATNRPATEPRCCVQMGAPGFRAATIRRVHLRSPPNVPEFPT
jgi:integrase